VGDRRRYRRGGADPRRSDRVRRQRRRGWSEWTSADRAVRAALEATGGGTVSGVERDGEDGAVWEVEVHETDGSVVDVRLDANYRVVVIDGDHETADANDGG